MMVDMALFWRINLMLFKVSTSNSFSHGTGFWGSKVMPMGHMQCTRKLKPYIFLLISFFPVKSRKYGDWAK